MKTIHRRIRKIEGRLWPDRKPQRLWILCNAGRNLALDHDRCVQILGECGFLPTERFGVVNLLQVPDGLNAEQLERFLRTNGSGDSWFHGNQNHAGPGARG